jgi:hypothetical protein
MDFTYCRAWVGFAYVSSILDVFAREIVAWHVTTGRDAELVMTPLRMVIWRCEREGHPLERDELIGHAYAGSQYTPFSSPSTWTSRASLRRSGQSAALPTVRPSGIA